MTGNRYLTQTQLAERWQVAESTLERWRGEGNMNGCPETSASTRFSACFPAP